MARTRQDVDQQARSRGTEGSVLLIVVVGALVAAAAFMGSQVVHLVGGIDRAFH